MPNPAPANPGNWFAAIPVELPEPFLEALRAGAPPLRWFAPEDIHLTVAFFGRYQSECMEAVRAALRALPAFEIRASLGPMVPRPSPRRFSAVSFELRQGSAEAAEIMRRFHAPLMAAAGLPPETRPAYPHITVARPDRRASGGGALRDSGVDAWRARAGGSGDPARGGAVPMGGRPADAAVSAAGHERRR